MIINSVIGGGGSASAFTITSSTGSNGTISPLGTTAVLKGGAQTYSMTANTGYEVDDVLVDGVSQGAVSTYTFNNVQADHTISVSFKVKTYTVTCSVSGSGGTISANPTTVNHGSSSVVTCSPATGYQINTLTVNGTAVTPVDNQYTITNITANQTVVVTFKKLTYTITVTQATGGVITPSTSTVEYGDSITFTVSVSTGYNLTAVMVDGSSVGTGTTYTFTNVTANHTITATYSIQTFTITTTAGSNGSISPTNPSVNYGANQTFTITADSGYEVDTVTVDGVSAGAVTTYTFSSVVATHTISATFKEGATSETHSFTINKATLQTSPTTCVSYESGYSAAQAYTWIMSKLHPSVVSNGTVNYFLDKTDLSKKLDGTSANLDGTDGDVMVSIEPLWWKVTTNDSSSLTIQISDAEISGGATAHLFNGTVRQYLHLGMFHMSGSAANSVYSTTATPWVSQTNDAFRTAAENRGSTYCTMTYRTWTLLEILTVFASGSCDSQTTCGQDYTGGSATTAVATAAMLTANGWTESTKSSATTSLMWLFISQPWGNVVDYISGILDNTGYTGIATDQYYARGVSVGTIPDTWTKFTIPSGASSGNYISEVMGETEYPFLPSSTSGGSSSTYYCDYGRCRSGTYCARVGGTYDYGALAGVFLVVVNASSSTAFADSGSRLQILDVNTA